MDNRKVERVYTSYARVYDRIFGKIFEEPRENSVRRLPVAGGDRVLEVGVGTGLSLPFYPSDCAITGIDLSQGMLDRAHELVAQRGLRNVALMRMDAAEMAFDDDSFDIVVAAYVMTVVPDPKRVMAEMVRVCKPSGKIIILNHFRNDNPVLGALERIVSPLCTHIGFRTDLKVDTVLRGAPLEVVRTEKVKPLRLWHLIECINAKQVVAAGAAVRAVS